MRRVPLRVSGHAAHAGGQHMLANALSARISLVPVPPDRVRFSVELAGDFPPSGADDLAQAFRDLGTSPLGKLLGLDQEDTPPSVHERSQRLVLDADLNVAPIARGCGLRRLGNPAARATELRQSTHLCHETRAKLRCAISAEVTECRT